MQWNIIAWDMEFTATKVVANNLFSIDIITNSHFQVQNWYSNSSIKKKHTNKVCSFSKNILLKFIVTMN